MKNISLNAMLFIAACAVSTGATGQKVYRCGNTYSHIPCPEAVAIDAVDARSKSQKLESDRANSKAAATANSLEKARLKTEDQAWANNKAEAAKLKKQTTKAEQPVTSPKSSDKKKESELFTAAASAAPKSSGTAKAAPSPAK